jgi:hypothetical protein
LDCTHHKTKDDERDHHPHELGRIDDSQTWDYEVADGREDGFIAALKSSQMVMEYVRLDEEPSPA